MNRSSLPRHPRTGLRAVGIVAGRPVWPIKGAAPTLTEQRDEVAKLLADPDYDGDIDELLKRADDIAAKIDQANQRDARLRALKAAQLPAGDPDPDTRVQPGLPPDDRGVEHPAPVAEAFVPSKALGNCRAGNYAGKFSFDHRAAPAGTVTTGTQPQQNTRVPGIIPQNPDFPLLVANLLDRQTSDGTTLEYMRDTSGPQSTWNKAAVVAEGGDKPMSGPFSFDLITTTLKTVAHWVPITRQAADDNGQLMGYI